MSETPLPISLHPNLLESLRRSFLLAEEGRHAEVSLEHLLLALLEDDSLLRVLQQCGVEMLAIQRGLEEYLKLKLERVPEGVDFEPTATLGFNRVLNDAAEHSLSAGKKVVDGGMVLASLLKEKESMAVFLLRRQGLTRLKLLKQLSHGPEAMPKPPQPAGEEEVESGEAVAADPLEAYTVDLLVKAAQGQLDPLVGRDKELRRIMQVLGRRRKNNPLLVGEPGVGKTALAEGLAQKIHGREVPENLKDARMFSLDLGSMIAGTRYRGDFEARVKAVLKALRAFPKAILLIDEIHTLVGAGSVSGGSLDASNLLKPALQSGELRCIGTTTFQDLKGSLDRDRALARRFQHIEVAEPTTEETIGILQGLRPHFEKHHCLRYSEAALETAARLASKHLKDKHLPDKAIDLLDEAGSAQNLLPPQERVSEIGPGEIEAIVAQMARIPPESVSQDDRQALCELESRLQRVIFGQDLVIQAVCSTIKLARAGLRALDKPMGCFLFAGPTGVGKTELSKQLAAMLGIGFLRFDMSEYMEKHAVSRLVGAPPGYVGFEEGGLLTDAVRKQPHAVLLLDELEKAHPEIYNILLQIMDHANLTDSHGRSADFRNLVLILTTNVGARELSGRRLGFASEEGGRSAGGALEKAFSPEFRNRLDGILHFAPLGREAILQVVDKQVRELQEQLVSKQVRLELSSEARVWLADHGHDPVLGARPMARLIEKELKRPLAESILFGALQKGGVCIIDACKGELRLECISGEEVRQKD